MSRFKPSSRIAEEDTRIALIEDALVPYERREDFVRELSKLWADAQKKFLQIGRYLICAKAALPHGEFEAMIERELPFGRAVAHKLRAVAEAIDGGKVPVDLLPRQGGYSVIYEVVALPDDARQQAIELGVIRPDMRRADLVEFKRKLRSVPALPPPTEIINHAPILSEEERVALESQRNRLLNELAIIEAKLGMTPIRSKKPA